MASISGLDHVGIVVADLDEAIATFSSLFDDTRAINRIDSVREFDPDGNLLEEITFAYIDTGNGVYLELMEPVSVGNGTIGTFLERRGEGIHHISFWVEPRSGFAEFFAQLQETPFVTVGETPWQSDPESNRNNVYTYIHPSSAHGTLIELITPYRFENGDMKAVETSEEAD